MPTPIMPLKNLNMNIQQKISSYITGHQNDMLGFLEKIVCIQSGSKNKSGVDQVGLVIEKVMTEMGFCCDRVKQDVWGDHIIARSPQASSVQNQILITGHMDTVFPRDTAFNFFKSDDTNCYGPGVADMKGGLVVGIFAIKALQHVMGREAVPPIAFIFNSDEEVGSPSSRPLIRKEAKKSRAAFVLEAGGLNNEIVTGRKGNLSIRLNVKGQAGHAAFAGKDKGSAILELAHKTIAIEALNNPEKGISANVGLIEGGIGPNTIPEHAKARMDFRFLTPEDSAQLDTQIKSCCQTPTIAGTVSTLEVISSRPAMPQTSSNTMLYDQINTIAQGLGMKVKPELRQGVSDANLIADEGIPVIDGLGPVGAKDHSEDEYINTRSLFDRTVLFSNVLGTMFE